LDNIWLLCHLYGTHYINRRFGLMWFKITADYGNMDRLQFWLWAENREALDELVAKKQKKIKKVHKIEEGLDPPFSQ
jgi:hypothetical protein